MRLCSTLYFIFTIIIYLLVILLFFKIVIIRRVFTLNMRKRYFIVYIFFFSFTCRNSHIIFKIVYYGIGFFFLYNWKRLIRRCILAINISWKRRSIMLYYFLRNLVGKFFNSCIVIFTVFLKITVIINNLLKMSWFWICITITLSYTPIIIIIILRKT